MFVTCTCQTQLTVRTILKSSLPLNNTDRQRHISIEGNRRRHFIETYAMWYKAFHIFGQTKFTDGGLVLASSQISVVPQLPPKIMLSLKEVKIDSKISNSLC